MPKYLKPTSNWVVINRHSRHTGIVGIVQVKLMLTKKHVKPKSDASLEVFETYKPCGLFKKRLKLTSYSYELNVWL